ncbi:hypothetical protein JCGZ_08315 [Jatropha curcas]|uniref:Uncharacterized protein n=1 Tax=Jatropha curcas TaxID=180498 RepID=A0A067KNF6_JATCU|nr:hypothetical protein JCGZ_08315 [Jatropha curcas]
MSFNHLLACPPLRKRLNLYPSASRNSKGNYLKIPWSIDNGYALVEKRSTSHMTHPSVYGVKASHALQL